MNFSALAFTACRQPGGAIMSEEDKRVCVKVDLL